MSVFATKSPEKSPILAGINSKERPALTEVTIPELDSTADWPAERQYKNRYGQLSDQLFATFVDSVEPRYRPHFERGDVRHGFRIVGALLRLAPPAYLEYCRANELSPSVDDMAQTLHDSTETPLEFSRMSNHVNKHVESQFGLRSADPEYSMEFADTKAGVRYRPVVFDFCAAKMNAGFFDEQRAHEAAGTRMPQCPGQRIIREAWHTLINTCQADPGAFTADIQA